MRTYEDSIKEYLTWYAEKVKDVSFLPDTYLNVDEEERKLRIAAIWKDILGLCYQETDGIYWFTKFVLGDLTYAGYPNPIVFNGLWRNWSKLVNKGDHIIIKCSRQHGKSTFWTVIQAIYRTSLFEHYNVLIESASEDQAVMLMSFIVRVIENNEFLHSKKAANAKWSTTEIGFNGGKIVGKGVGSEVRGGTYDYIVCDDILRSDNKLSDDDIERFIDEELEPMIFVRKGQIVIVGTPKSETDIFATIEERVAEGGKWIYNTYPAITNWDKKELLCPDRFTWEQLMAKQANMGRMKFDKEFMCLTYSTGSQLFPFEIRKRAKDLGAKEIMHPYAKTKDANKWRYYMGVDVARAGTASADFTVAVVLAYNPDTQVKRVVWYWRKKGLKIVEQVKQIAKIAKDFNFPIILVEKNNIGQEFIDVMVDNYNLSVESFMTGSKGQGKEDLIRGLISTFENEKMILPTGDELSRSMVDEIDKELERFVVEITKVGNEIFKGSGKSHDDMVIALALANRCSQSYGYIPFAASIDTKRTTALEQFQKSDDARNVMEFGFTRGDHDETDKWSFIR